MTRTIKATLLLSVALFAGPALAQDAVELAARDFVAAGNAEVLPLEHIEGALNDLLHADPAAMIPADVDISPVEKALLLIDTQEEPLSRMRYLLRYNTAVVDGVELSLVSVERYNLGPATREETILAYGAENTAGPEAFGIGPHVRWRFVTQPTAKSAALLLAASREEIGEKTAQRASCLIRTCLSLDPMDGLAGWSEWAPYEMALPDVAYPAIIASPVDDDATELSPAILALQLAQAAGLADGLAWSMPERQGGDNDTPILVVLIDRNLGQEIMSDAALGVGKMGLDSEEYWTRISGGVFDGTANESIATAQGPLQ